MKQASNEHLCYYYFFILFLATLMTAKCMEDAQDKSVGTCPRILQFALKTLMALRRSGQRWGDHYLIRFLKTSFLIPISAKTDSVSSPHPRSRHATPLTLLVLTAALYYTHPYYTAVLLICLICRICRSANCNSTPHQGHCGVSMGRWVLGMNDIK